MAGVAEGIGGVGPGGGATGRAGSGGVKIRPSRAGECIHMPPGGPLVLHSQSQWGVVQFQQPLPCP